MFAKLLPVALTVAVSLASGCGSTSDVACDRVYNECKMSLTSGGAAASYETCQSQMQMVQNEKLASCLAKAECGNMSACLGGSTPATPPAAPAPPATGGGAEGAAARICHAVMNVCKIPLSANGQPLSIQQCSQAMLNPQNVQLVQCLGQRGETCAGVSSCFQ
jgi:hypothetical protein